MVSIVVLIGIPAAIRDAEHLVLWWRFDLVFSFFFSLKGVRTIYLWKLASWSCPVLEYISPIPAPGHFLRAAVINRTTALVN